MRKYRKKEGGNEINYSSKGNDPNLFSNISLNISERLRVRSFIAKLKLFYKPFG